MPRLNKLLALSLFFVLTVLIFVALIKNKNQIGSDKIQITTSFYPLYFFATEIGGDKVQVTNITPAGAEPHDYEPTVSDIIKMEESKILILNGSVEPWANKIRDDIKGKDVALVTTSEDTIPLDPHTWLSPKLAKSQVQKIAEALVKLNPENKSYYEENEKELIKKLSDLDSSYKTDLTNCDTRTFVTSHAAFSYLAKDFNLNQVAISGLSPDSEPSLKELATITNLVKANNIKYIFFESLVNPKLSETIAYETGATTLVLDPIEGLTRENLQKGANYFTLMNDNLKNLKVALSCK